MAKIVAERNRLRKIFVQAQRTCDSASDLSNLKRMRQARAIMVLFRVDEYLRLVLQPPERFRVHYSVPVPLKFGADGTLLLRPGSAPRLHAEGSMR